MRMIPRLTKVPHTSWFKYNNFKANANKCHFFLSPYQSATINIDGSIIKSNNSQKLLGVTRDSNLTFDERINSLCRKSSKNYKLCPEYYNMHHRLRSAFCLKRF